MISLNDKLENIKKLEKQIEELITLKQYKEALHKIKSLENITSKSKVFTYKSVVFLELGQLCEAIDTLEQGKIIHIFCSEIYFNLGYLYLIQKNYEKSLLNYYYSLKYSISEEDKIEAQSAIQYAEHEFLEFNKQEVVEQKVKQIQSEIANYDGRLYPLNVNGESLIRNPQKCKTSDEYMLNMYEGMNFSDIDINSRFLFKTELIKGGKYIKEKKIVSKGNIIIPISKIESNTTLSIEIKNKKYNFDDRQLPLNQFNYIKIKDAGLVSISSNKEFFIGLPIERKQNKKQTPKLILKIFIDGLSYQYLENNGLNSLMPNVAEFFANGYESTNCHTTSEWTLPSKAATNTGLYPNKHKMLHPHFFYEFNKRHKLLAEYLNDAGYYCTHISGNWRTTPTLGYSRGFNRMIYQNFLGGFDSKAIVMEAIEHLESFDDINHFLSLSLLDLHNVADEIENHLFSQTQLDIKNKVNLNKKGETSVLTEYDANKAVKYYKEIQRVDVILGILFNYINKKYKENEILVILHSDHGQSYLDKETYLLSDQRLRIPFFIKGNNIPKAKSNEFMEIVDILPTILKNIGYEKINQIDGNVPMSLKGDKAREYVFSQAIHPNQTYKARIKEENISYYFESKHMVQDNLMFDLEGFQSKIIDNLTNQNVTELYKDKLNAYDNFVFNKIQELIV